MKQITFMIILYIAFNSINAVFCIVNNNDTTNDDDDEQQPGEYGKDWVLFPDDKGYLHFVNISNSHKVNITIIPGNVYFQLYTRNNPHKCEDMFIEDTNATEEEHIISNYFSEDKDLKFITHGWLSNGQSSGIIDMKNAYLESYDVNVIVVDWGEISQNLFYTIPAYQTRYVGNQIGKMVKTIKKHYSITEEMIHLVGHSLGAQVVGFAGRWLKEHNMTIARITGLDPARPHFEIPPPTDGIQADDAKFVDIIHTNGGFLGVRKSHGVVDFYPNGGHFQAGCNLFSELVDACSHSRAYKFFTESIRTGGFLSRRCSNWSSYKKGECDDNDAMNMGYTCQNSAEGDYYLYTNTESPYSKDEDNQT